MWPFKKRKPQPTIVQIKWSRVYLHRGGVKNIPYKWENLAVTYDAWGNPSVRTFYDRLPTSISLYENGIGITEYDKSVDWIHVSGPAVTFPTGKEQAA